MSANVYEATRAAIKCRLEEASCKSSRSDSAGKADQMRRCSVTSPLSLVCVKPLILGLVSC